MGDEESRWNFFAKEWWKNNGSTVITIVKVVGVAAVVYAAFHYLKESDEPIVLRHP